MCEVVGPCDGTIGINLAAKQIPGFVAGLRSHHCSVIA